MKPIKCKHCGAVNVHYSFQCHTQRKPIKVGEVTKMTWEQYQEKKGNKKLYKPSKPKDDKSMPELIKLATIVFNKAVKERQSVNGKAKCMACNNWFDKSETDASHLYSAGKYPSVRFNENNVNICCIECNRYLEGNLEPYRKNLEDKIGHIAMAELKDKAMVSDFKWDREELLEIIKQYK